jgi:hypothetical protein
MMCIYYWKTYNFTLLSRAINYVTWYLAMYTVSVVKMESEMGRRGLAGIYFTHIAV